MTSMPNAYAAVFESIKQKTSRSRELDSLLANIIETGLIATFVLNRAREVIHWNSACERLTGIRSAEIVGKTDAWTAFYVNEQPTLADFLLRNDLTGARRQYKIAELREDGLIKFRATAFFPKLQPEGRWLTFTASLIVDDFGEVVGAYETVLDITAELSLQKRLQFEHHLLSEVIDNSPIPMFIINTQHHVTHWNKACEQLNNIPASDIIGTTGQWQAFYIAERPTLADLVLENLLNDTTQQIDIAALYDGYCQPAKTLAGAWEAVYRFTNLKSGSKWLYFTAAPVFGTDGTLIGVLETLQDITEQKNHETKLAHTVNHDFLTGLANRQLLLDRLEKALQYADRDHQQLAVLLVDIDNFKQINYTYGQSFGDSLIKVFGSRLKDCVREIDTVARIGGDQYVILLHSPRNEDHINGVINTIQKAVCQRISTGQKDIQASCSIGVSIYPRDSEQPEELLRQADDALHRAKSVERGSFRYYTDDLNSRAELWMQLKQDLHLALERHEFELYYQPQFEIETLQILGAEALLRWNHPTRGRIPPDVFIPIAEETGLIMQIGEWVIRTAVLEATYWEQLTRRPYRVSVNVSTRQFQRAEILNILQNVFETSALSPKYLELELTESLVMANPKRAEELLQTLKSRGFLIAMDDFGTGYSSLSYLQRFPFDTIKIDKSFIDGLSNSDITRTIVRSIVELGAALKLRMVAEGIETPDQLEMLKSYGCREVQGYLFSRPVSASEFRGILENVQQVTATIDLFSE